MAASSKTLTNLQTQRRGPIAGAEPDDLFGGKYAHEGSALDKLNSDALQHEPRLGSFLHKRHNRALHWFLLRSEDHEAHISTFPGASGAIFRVSANHIWS